jgi:hypothetical protein
LKLTMIMERVRKFISSTTWMTFWVVMGVSILSYAIYIPWLGIYGDDWQYFYVYHLLGVGEYGHFVMADRPFSVWVYALVMPIFGEHFLGYQLLLFALRIGTAMAFAWVLRLIWKDKPWQVAWLAVLFVVYPTFKQQPVPLEYVLHFTGLILFFVSLGLMLLSLENRKRYIVLTVFALICSASMFSVEYFVGLEFARPLMIWWGLKRQDGKFTWTDVFKRWLPYGILLAAFYYWRIFIFSFQKYKPVLLSDLAAKPGKTVVELGWRIFQDFVNMLFRVWGQAFNVIDSFPAIFLQAAIIIGGLFFVFFVLRWVRKNGRLDKTWTEDGWGIQILAAGLILMLLAGIPFWTTGIPLWLDFPWDRTTLAFMPGACLTVMGLVDLVVQTKFRNLFLAGLIGLSLAIHYQNNLSFMNEWQDARNLMWQLTWRAPMIKPGTMLVTDGIPLNYYGDNSLSPVINWTYAPDWHQAQIPYRLFDLNIRQDSPIFANLARHLPVEHIYRSFEFRGSTDQLLAVSLKADSCLKIYGSGEVTAPETSNRIKDILYLSDLNLIDPAPTKPAVPPLVMGSEPKHEWCYYFEKADLARQMGDWEKVVKLGNEAGQNHLQAKSAFENLVFIEGYGRLQQWNKAAEMTISASENVQVVPQLCALWAGFSQTVNTAGEAKTAINAEINRLKCRP